MKIFAASVCLLPFTRLIMLIWNSEPSLGSTTPSLPPERLE
jgi:hypothetical protein